jgi:hypothetical protein
VLAYSHRVTTSSRRRTRICWSAAWRFPDAPRAGYAVVVDLLVNDAIRQQLQRTPASS